jgi:hypothetical protein
MRKLSPWLHVILALVILAFFLGSVELSASPYLPRPQGEEYIPLNGVCRAPSGFFSIPLNDRPILGLMPAFLLRSERFVEAQLPDITTMLPNLPLEQGAAFLGKIMVKAEPRLL